MIITCPQDGKKFEVDNSLIQKKEGWSNVVFCGHKWHFNIKQSIKEINKKNKNFTGIKK